MSITQKEIAHQAALHAVTAVSPLDGRYKRYMDDVREVASEFGLMKARVHVELTYFAALSRAGFPQFRPLSSEAENYARNLVRTFSPDDTLAIKKIEVGVPAEGDKPERKGTNHDVKAVEYWIHEKFAGQPELHAKRGFVHFACTSEDINNVAHALQLKYLRDMIVLPKLQKISDRLYAMAHDNADVPMLARTHGQPASPTTVGKELHNVFRRLERARGSIREVKFYAKMNGAVGNYNAHLAAYPDFDWQSFTSGLISAMEPYGFGLTPQTFTTQIEPHDYIAEFFDAVARANTILLDLCRDIWHYISIFYFKQRVVEGEVGSSTMPHKVNPIDFENAEGNLGLANAVLRHMAEKLPISRLQRDLTDSTVLRNMGTALGYCVLAYESLLKGLEKLEVNHEALSEDLDDAWEVVGEPIQIILKREGVADAYEKLKELMRGRKVTREMVVEFVEGLDMPNTVKTEILRLSPRKYTGMAAKLVREDRR